MGLHDPFGHLKHKLWPKEGPWVKLTIWFSTTKVRNCPNFLVCSWRATDCWKSFNEGCNFFSNLILIGGLHTKLWAPKIAEVPTLGISRFPLGNPKTKCHLGVSLIARHITYSKGRRNHEAWSWSFFHPSVPSSI
jgi:hypothetical protein